MLQEIEDQIEIAFLSTHNEQRQSTEKILIRECLARIDKFLLLPILVQTPDHKYAQHATILINTIVKKIVENPNRSSLHHFFVLQLLVSNPNVTIKNRILLTDGLSNLMIADDNNSNKLGLREKLLGNLSSILKKPKLKEIIYGSLFFSSIIKSMQFGTYHFVQRPPKYADWVFDFLNVTKQVMNLIDNDNVNETELIDTIVILSITVTEMCELIFNQYGEFKTSCILFQNTILNSEAFFNFLFTIIQYRNPNMIYYIFNEKESETPINKVKLGSFKCYFYALKTLIQERNAKDWARIPFTQQVKQVTQALAYQALIFMGTNSVNQLQVIHLQIFSYILQILAYSAVKHSEVFIEGKVNYMLELIYPFVISTKQEMINMTENPQDFVSLSQDAIQYQKTQIPKIGAIKLLQNLCKFIEDCTTPFLSLIITIIKQAILEITNIQLANEYEQIVTSNIQDKSFFKFYSPIQRIESSLVILASLNTYIHRNTKYLRQIEGFLVQTMPFFLQTKEVIIQSRLLLFLGYYSVDLLKSDEALSEQIITYLDLIIRCISNETQVILYQSIDTLLGLIEENTTQQKLIPIIPALYDALVKTLVYSQQFQHFSLIDKIIVNYIYLFLDQPRLLTSLCQVLVQRIILEEQIIQSGDQTRYFFCTRSWALLKDFLKREFISIIPSMNQALSPVYEMIALGQSLYFEDEFLSFVDEEIALTSTITDQQFKLMDVFQTLVKNNHDRLSSIFDTLNLFLIYDRNRFLDQCIQQKYFAIALQALLSQKQQCAAENKALGAHLIQIGVEIFNKDISFSVIKPILIQLLRMLQSEDVHYIVKSKITSVFWAAFYTMPDIISQLLPQTFDSLYEYLLEFNIHIGCDNKTRVISQCQIIMNDPHRFTSQTILNIAYSLQWQHEHFYKDWEHQTQHHDYVGDEDSEDLCFFEDEQAYLQFIQEDVQLQFRSSSLILRLNEYDAFKGMFAYFREKYPQFIELLNQQLKSSETSVITEVLSYIKVEIEDGYDESRKTMKASKKKQKIQSQELKQ